MNRDIASAWNSRLETIRSAKFEWQITRIENKSRARDGELEMKQRGEFLMDRQGRVRYRVAGQSMSPDEKSIMPQDTVKAFDGKMMKEFDPHPEAAEFPVGSVYPQNEVVRSYSMDPLLWWLGIKPAEMGIGEPQAFSRDTRIGVVGGTDCIVVETGSPRKSHTLWLDPKRGYLILRAQISLRGQLRRQYDVTYTPDSTAGWVPRQWKMIEVSGNGAPIWSMLYQVSSYEINVPTQPSDFQIEFPAGTIVTDTSTGEFYLQREAGNKRLILPEEYQAGYQRVLTTETGMAVDRGNKRGLLGTLLLYVLPLLLLATMLFLFVKFRRRKQ